MLQGPTVNPADHIRTLGTVTEFFVPDVEDAEKAYEAIVKGAEDPRDLGRKSVPRRIFRLRYRHNGRTLQAEVGRDDPLDGEKVMAILDMGDLYSIRTVIRGYLKIGNPILVGKHAVLDVEEFE